MHSITRKSVFLLPNLITTAALFCGCLGLINAFSGTMQTAVLWITAAAILDGLDGRVARITKSQSNFGAEYDSLSDVVAFGVAPGMCAFSWGLNYLDRLGWALAFIYIASTAMRLARFTSNIKANNPNYFQGLPSPGAALALISMIWIFAEYDIAPDATTSLIILGAVTAGLGVLMMSFIPFYSFKGIKLNTSISVIQKIGLVVVFGLIIWKPFESIAGFFVVYISHAVAMFVWRWRWQDSMFNADKRSR